MCTGMRTNHNLMRARCLLCIHVHALYAMSAVSADMSSHIDISSLLSKEVYMTQRKALQYSYHSTLPKSK
jgi:hypothetical protein